MTITTATVLIVLFAVSILIWGANLILNIVWKKLRVERMQELLKEVEVYRNIFKCDDGKEKVIRIIQRESDKAASIKGGGEC